MGNVSHRVASIHPMLAVAPAGVIIHNPEFARWAASERGDAAVIDGAKAMALTALELMSNREFLFTVRGDFESSAELSRLAVAKTGDVPPIQNPHAHAGCGCT
jgi:hypothetical protein